MKKYLLPSIKLTALMILLCAVLYPLLIAGIAKMAPGLTVSVNGKVVGYENIGQKFTADKYFWGRPSAVDYNAAGSAGSNKGPSNADYLLTVKERIDSFLVHNPGVTAAEIPAEMVTASGSGLDPDISPASALIQIKRVATQRNMDENKLVTLVAKHTEGPLLGILGPSRVNVLKLNIDLDKLN
jgi:K+-transporting ATPase ATPase C chain